jgi:hypothetical protein
VRAIFSHASHYGTDRFDFEERLQDAFALLV